MHPLDPIAPLFAKCDERFLYLVESFRASTYEPMAMYRALDDEPSVFEDRDMTLNRCERHRVCGGEIAHGPFAPHRAGDDVAPCGVCERS